MKVSCIYDCMEYTAETKSENLADGAYEEMKELKRLAEIGEAVECAITFSECDDYLAQANITPCGQPKVTGEMWGSVSELLDWYRTHKPTE